jgi:Tol biopolymer transport system component
VDSGKFRRITNDLNEYNGNTLAITKDGRQLIAVEVTPSVGLYVMSSEPNTAASAPIDTRGDTSVGWTPDGRLVAIDYDGHIATLNADGSNRTVIYSQRLFMQNLSVCQDGQHVLFSMPNKQTNGLSIFVLDLPSGNAKPLTSGKADQNTVCSPDSKYLLYTKLENGKTLLMRMPLEGGDARQIFEGFATSPTISPDGLQVAVATLEGTGTNAKLLIKIIGPDGGPAIRTVPTSPKISGHMQFSADGKSLYYPINQHGVSNIVRRSIDGGELVAVTNFNDLMIRDYSYDWKNKKLAVARGQTSTDVVLIKEQKSE